MYHKERFTIFLTFWQLPLMKLKVAPYGNSQFSLLHTITSLKLTSWPRKYTEYWKTYQSLSNWQTYLAEGNHAVYFAFGLWELSEQSWSSKVWSGNYACLQSAIDNDASKMFKPNCLPSSSCHPTTSQKETITTTKCWYPFGINIGNSQHKPLVISNVSAFRYPWSYLWSLVTRRVT